MPYSASHTWVAGDFIRASWLNLDTTNLADHETRMLALEAATVAIDDLTDVALSSPVSDGHFLRYTGTEWTNETAGVADLSDVALTSPLTAGEALTWDGSNWTNDTAASAISELTDVTLTSPVSSGEALVYNGTNWTNQVASSITWRGDWDSGTAYSENDAVYHNGSSYIATSASTNNEPGVGSPDPWDLIALSGLAGNWRGEWDSGTAYSLGDLVQHNGSSYFATGSSTNDEPGVGSPDPWDLVAAKGDTGSVGALDDLTDVSATSPNDGDVLTYQAGSPTGWIAAAPASRVIGLTLDGGGSAITTGIKADLYIPFACTITAATLLADQTGDLVVDLWVDAYANFPPTDADSITASAPPTLSSAASSQDTTLTGWTTSISAGSVMRFNVDSAATVTRAALSLTVTI